jgi:hypothetical protein
MLSRLGRAKPDPTTRPRMHRWAGLAARGVSAVALGRLHCESSLEGGHLDGVVSVSTWRTSGKPRCPRRLWCAPAPQSREPSEPRDPGAGPR